MRRVDPYSDYAQPWEQASTSIYRDVADNTGGKMQQHICIGNAGPRSETRAYLTIQQDGVLIFAAHIDHTAGRQLAKLLLQESPE